MLNTTTLRPGLLVSLKTTLTGNVSYRKETIDPDHLTSDGERRAKWETERTVKDAAEHERGTKARSEAASLIRAVCARSAFGLLCPESAAAELDGAIRKARTIADAFNQGAQLSRLGVYVITGRIAPDDVEAVKAINSEVRELMTDMEAGLANLDVEAIREAANKAKQLGAMLTDEAAARIQTAIDAARSAARRIVKAGEAAACEVDRAALAKVQNARTAFLDLDGGQEMQAPAAPSRALDLAPPPADLFRAPGTSRSLEL
jgi:hypothetical protein